MALEVKITFLEQDKSGRKITLADTTGLESQGVATGYGPPNNPSPEDILSYIIVVSRLHSMEEYSVTIDGSDPLLPSIVDIANGEHFTINSSMFSGYKEAARMFCDGVMNIDTYVRFLGQSGLTIEGGMNTIVGEDFSGVLEGDAIIVGEVIYQIDKTKSTDEVLFIVGEFEEDATSFDILYQSNLKVLLTAVTDNLHDYACKMLQKNTKSPEWINVNTALSFRFSAIGFWNAEVTDYSTADSMMDSRYRLLNKYQI